MESTERDAPSSVRARHAAARVAPDRGSWQAPYHEPRGSAPRERDHRGGDHPVPSRTRQLSPPSPRVLQREAAGGQGVAFAEGAFLMRASPRLAEVVASRAGRSALRRIRPPPGIVGRAGTAGGSSLAGLSASWGIVRRGGLMKAPFRVPGARPTAAHARHPPIAVPGARPEGRPCRAVLRSGAARLLGSALYVLRVISPGASDGFLCAVGWSEAGFLSLCAVSRFGFLLVTESAYVDYNLKAIYSSLAQCWCMGMRDLGYRYRALGACRV